jgi:hypothetical protein
MTVKMYEVGESLLNKKLDLSSKVMDVAVVAPDMKTMITSVDSRTKGIKRFSNGDPDIGAGMSVTAFDMSGNLRRFFLCRDQGVYAGERYNPGTLSLGSIESFLSQCAFTALAIAKDLDSGKIIDPFGGIEDIDISVLRCTKDPALIFEKDPAVIFQGVRLAITKGLSILNPDLRIILNSDPESLWVEKINRLPIESIKPPLNECFAYNSAKTIHFLHTEMFWIYQEMFKKGSKLRLEIK